MTDPTPAGMTEFIAALPKVELHVHLEGSVPPRALLALARRNGVDLGVTDEAGLRARYRFTDFPAFVAVYVTVCDCLRSGADFALITEELGRAGGAAEYPLSRSHLHRRAPCARRAPFRRTHGRHRGGGRGGAGRARRRHALHSRLPARLRRGGRHADRGVGAGRPRPRRGRARPRRPRSQVPTRPFAPRWRRRKARRPALRAPRRRDRRARGRLGRAGTRRRPHRPRHPRGRRPRPDGRTAPPGHARWRSARRAISAPAPWPRSPITPCAASGMPA